MNLKQNNFNEKYIQTFYNQTIESQKQRENLKAAIQKRDIFCSDDQ